MLAANASTCTDIAVAVAILTRSDGASQMGEPVSRDALLCRAHPSEAPRAGGDKRIEGWDVALNRSDEYWGYANLRLWLKEAVSGAYFSRQCGGMPCAMAALFQVLPNPR